MPGMRRRFGLVGITRFSTAPGAAGLMVATSNPGLASDVAARWGSVATDTVTRPTNAAVQKLATPRRETPECIVIGSSIRRALFATATHQARPRGIVDAGMAARAPLVHARRRTDGSPAPALVVSCGGPSLVSPRARLRYPTRVTRSLRHGAQEPACRCPMLPVPPVIEASAGIMRGGC